jgi:DNA-binding ferritin-like protein
MEIKIVSYNQGSDLETTKYFAILLSKALSIIHLVHWYVPNFQAHEVIGDLYEVLDGHFDKLQEEIIGTVKIQEKPFPSFSPETFNLDDLDQFEDNAQSLMDTLNKTTIKLVAILDSQEFNMFIGSVNSGINNTKEDILSAINKADYLLSMIYSRE